MKPPYLFLFLTCAVPAYSQDADFGLPAAMQPVSEAASQDVTATDRPVDLPGHPLDRLQAALIDERPGRVLIRGKNYRAALRPSGFRFEPVFNSQAPHSFPIDFTLARATVGDTPLALDTPAVSSSDQLATLDYGALRETYHLSAGSVEQTFVFDRLSTLGELVVELEVSTDLSASFEGTDLVFRHPDFGYVTYGEALAYDATGATTPVEREWDNGHLRLRVPADFVARAVAPLVIDPPLVSFSNDFGFQDDTAPDVCFDETSQLYWVVWEDFVTATDSDCILTTFSPLGVQGITVGVDSSDDDWREPRVAYHHGAGKLMVVANVELASTGVGVVQGRILDVATTTWDSSPFAISNFGSVKRYADVGGNSWNSTVNAHFLVTWSFEFSPGNHNPQYRVIDWTGTPITGVLTVDGGGNDDIHTSVSQSLGDVTLPGDFWTMVWTRDSNGDGRGEIWARRVSWNGDPSQGAGNFQVFTNTQCSWPSVTSRLNDPAPITGDRPSIVAFQRETPNGGSTQSDVILAVVTDGATLGTSIVSMMEDVHSEVDQQRPAIASDRRTFLLAYQEQDWSTSQTTFDTYMTSGNVGYTATTAYIALGERHQPMATSSATERFVRIGSRWDAGTPTNDDAAAVWQIDDNQIAGAILDAIGAPAGDDISAGAQLCEANGHSGSTSLSADQSSWISIQSDLSVASTAFVNCVDVPFNQFGYLLVSQIPMIINMPGGSMGRLCLGGAGRYTANVQSSGNSGTFVTSVDPLALPQPAGTVSAAPGETWFFQYWHRDFVAGSPTSNFSNAAGIVFTP